MKQGFRLNDFGSKIQITIIDSNGENFDLTGYTDLKLIFKKPDDSKEEKTASIVGLPTSGVIEYIVESGFLNQTGIWEVQAYIKNSAGAWHSNINSFLVWENLAS